MKDTHGNRLFDDRGAAAEAWRRRPDGVLDGVDLGRDEDASSTPTVHPAAPLRLDNGRQVYVETSTHAAAGAGIGGAIGAVLGAIVMAVMSVGTSIALPGLGWVISGAVAAALAGAGAGATLGGLVGAFVGLSMRQERVHRVAPHTAHEPAQRWHDRPPEGTLH